MPKYLINESERLDRRITFNMCAKDHDKLVSIAGKQCVPFGQILRELTRNYLKKVAK